LLLVDELRMIRFFSSLRFRLLLLVLLALVPALGLVLKTASDQRRLAGIQAQENALRLARAAAGSQEQLIGNAQQLLFMLAQLPAMRDPAACNTALAQLLKNDPRFTAIAVLEVDETRRCGAFPRSFSPDVSVRTPALHYVYEQAVATLKPVVGGYGIGPYSGRGVLAFGSPILDENGALEAVLTCTLDVASLNRLAAQLLMPAGSTLTENDRDGTIVARYPDPQKWVGRSLPDAPIIQIVLSRRGEGTVEAVGEDGATRLYAFTRLNGVPNNEMYVSVGIPTDVAYAEANQTLAANLIALGLVAVFALGAAWFASDLFVLRQVKDLLQVTGRLADGNLSARTGLRHGVGELDQLANAFDRMVDALEQREAERRQVEEQVRRQAARAEALVDVLQQQERTRAELLHRAITAQEDERMRIARELHDETSQSLTALIVGLDTARMTLGPGAGRTAEYLQNARQITKHMLEDIRRLISDLRPTLLDDMGLLPAIAWYGEKRLKPAGIALHLDKTALPERLPSEMETVLFRVVQEALTNVVRHAGATVVEVRLAIVDGVLTMQVADNGRGFDLAPNWADSGGKGFGLRGMRERVHILGGDLQLQTAAGQGTLISVRVPMPGTGNDYA
jgi:signal transduction histidine kinase